MPPTKVVPAFNISNSQMKTVIYSYVKESRKKVFFVWTAPLTEGLACEPLKKDSLFDGILCSKL